MGNSKTVETVHLKNLNSNSEKAFLLASVSGADNSMQEKESAECIERCTIVAENISSAQKEAIEKILGSSLVSLQNESLNNPTLSVKGSVTIKSCHNKSHSIYKNFKADQEVSILINNTEESFLLLDMELNIVTFNKQFSKFQQVYFDEQILQNTNILIYNSAHKWDSVKKIYANALAGNTEIHEVSVTDKIGNKKYYSLKYSPAKNNDDDIFGVFVTGIDVTDATQAKEKLKRSENRFRSLVENSTDAVVILNEEGKPFYGSPSIEKLLGYTEKEVLQIRLMDVIHAEDKNQVALHIAQSYTMPGKTMPSIRGRVLHKNGSWRWMECVLTNMLQDPNIGGLVDNFRDITDTVESELEILYRQQMLEQAEINYRQIFNNASEAIFVHAIETGFIIDLNNKACEMLGADKQFIIENPAILWQKNWATL